MHGLTSSAWLTHKNQPQPPVDYASRFLTQTSECTNQEVREVDAVETYVYTVESGSQIAWIHSEKTYSLPQSSRNE
jgi:hypothetical protein